MTIWTTLLLLLPLQDAESPSYNRDVRPILAAKCFACHGPDSDSREADLRLDTRKGATAEAVVPGKPAESELIRRITSTNDKKRMPPRKTGKTLSGAEIALLRRWIAAGAEYSPHWAFVPPRSPKIPDVDDARWPRNPIDRFVLRRLEKEGLRPSPEADKHTLIRRLSLDLVGLPPTPEEADAFAADPDPRSVEKLIDRLLGAPQYGEHWARQWLDLARYADTNGYEKDRPRSIWPYRDWVIRALNRDMPFDQFSIRQLAGDMLPDATLEDRIATGFHRNTMLNEEGGIDPLEFRFYAMVDRVATTGTVWLGMTTGCAQCHSHKYDPISHQDYYRMMALLDNADEPDLIVHDPAIAKRRAEILAKIDALKAKLADRFPPGPGEGDPEPRRRKHLDQKFSAWIAARRPAATAWTTLRPTLMKTNLPRLELLEDGSIFSTGDITKRDVFTLTFDLGTLKGPIDALRLEVLPDDRLPAGGPGRCYYEGRKGDFFLSEVTGKKNGQPVAFSSASHSYGKISIGSGNAKATNVIDRKGSTGWSTAEREGEAHQLVLNLKEPIAADGELEIELLFERHFSASLGRFRISAARSAADRPQPEASALPVQVEALLARDPAKWTEQERVGVRAYYLGIAPELSVARKEIEKLRKSLPKPPTTMVLVERPTDNPRPTYRRHRGEYLKVAEKVSPGVPGVFPPLPPDRPANRLEFARWLVSDRNPLAARVAVNRAWRSFFGYGLIRTSGDFGTQSEAPTHPELLDWLARRFVEDGWSLKKLHRLIATSSTYRQASRMSSELARRDPSNRLLARGPRFRVDAEVVRDIMLTASGLLSGKIGGPSVYPPQPESVTALAYGKFKWKPSKGGDRHRRSLYTFKKRTAPFAAYSVFDSPTGETCIARRNRSNTPLQVLNLLNDEMFLEMARALARKAVDAEKTARARTVFLFRRLLTRPPDAEEVKRLVAFHGAQKARFDAGALDAGAVLKSKGKDPDEAAWVLVARAIMNLDEAITKP